jgi:hypothetical protein
MSPTLMSGKTAPDLLIQRHFRSLSGADPQGTLGFGVCSGSGLPIRGVVGQRLPEECQTATGQISEFGVPPAILLVKDPVGDGGRI